MLQSHSAPSPAPAPSRAGVEGHPAPVTPPIGVYIIDEQPLFRRGLAAMLAADSAFRWLGEASSAAEAVAAAHSICPDVVLVDLSMPEMGGPEALAALPPLWPSCRFLVMGSQIRLGDLRAWVAAGASFVHKSVSPLELGADIRAVARGQRVLSPAVVASLDAQARELALRDELTPRERALLQLMAQGMDNRSISQTLDISVPTVKFHVTNIMSKLRVSNRTAAVLVALREKIVRLDEPNVAGRSGG